MKLEAVVQKLVAAGNIRPKDGDELVASGAGNIKARARELLNAGKITQAQHDELVASGAGN
jgi:hypothetical protein